LQELIHHHEEQLPLRSKVRVERPRRRAGSRGDLLDRRRVVAFLREELLRRVEQPPALLDAPRLLRLRRELLVREQQRRPLHRRSQTPATAPPQQISIQPPKSPAAA